MNPIARAFTVVKKRFHSPHRKSYGKEPSSEENGATHFRGTIMSTVMLPKLIKQGKKSSENERNGK